MRGVTAKGGWSPNRDTRRRGWRRPLDLELVAGCSYLMEICFPGTFPSETTFRAWRSNNGRAGRCCRTRGLSEGEGGALRSRAVAGERKSPGRTRDGGFRNDQASEGFWWSRVEEDPRGETARAGMTTDRKLEIRVRLARGSGFGARHREGEARGYRAPCCEDGEVYLEGDIDVGGCERGNWAGGDGRHAPAMHA